MIRECLHPPMRQLSRPWLRRSLRDCKSTTIHGPGQSAVKRQQHMAASSHTSNNSNNLPRIAQSSLWDMVFPRSIRDKSREIFRPSATQRPTNPASYFIWIYILIGSQAVRILSIQNEHKDYMRKADLKIARLREVVEKLQRGDEVDVEKVLGSGDPTQEQEWEDAMREIENEERIWQESKKQRDADRERWLSEQKILDDERRDASPVSVNSQAQRPTTPGFY